jgi:HK97 family phage prohead protease
MIIRTKSGEYRAATTSVLLDYLGVTKKAAGIQKLSGDVELIASVPIQMSREQRIKCEEERTEGSEGVAWTFSTFDLDRYGERIDPLGWDFSQFIKNPVIQWAHCFQIPAIGRAENIHVDENGLHGSLIFNDKEYDRFGWSIGERVKYGVIRAGSVGFRVIEIEIPSAADSKDGTSLIFRKQELLEFSVCNVPANPWALIKNYIKGELEATREEEKEMINQVGPLVVPFWNNLINNQ